MRTMIIMSLVLSVCGFSREENFSDQAWKRIEPIYQKIVQHEFNQELAAGTLPKEKFSYYEAQDKAYLKEFTKALLILTSKMENEAAIEKLLGLVRNCLQEVNTSESNAKMNLINIGYTSFLLATASFKSREELAAALLPCYWIYLRVALDLKDRVKESNPYAKWFKVYYSENYRKDVLSMIEISNQLAKNTDEKTLEKMLESFETAAQWELAFWNAAYLSMQNQARN